MRTYFPFVALFILCILMSACGQGSFTDEDTYKLSCIVQDGIPVKHPQTGVWTCLLKGRN